MSAVTKPNSTRRGVDRLLAVTFIESARRKTEQHETIADREQNEKHSVGALHFRVQLGRLGHGTHSECEQLIIDRGIRRR